MHSIAFNYHVQISQNDLSAIFVYFLMWGEREVFLFLGIVRYLPFIIFKCVLMVRISSDEQISSDDFQWSVLMFYFVIALLDLLDSFAGPV